MLRGVKAFSKKNEISGAITVRLRAFSKPRNNETSGTIAIRLRAVTAKQLHYVLCREHTHSSTRCNLTQDWWTLSASGCSFRLQNLRIICQLWDRTILHKVQDQVIYVITEQNQLVRA